MAIRRTLIGLSLAGLVATAGGCLVMSGKSIEQHGVKISSSTLQQIECGTTTEAWLVATLGEPAERTVVEGQENVSVLRYDYVETRSEGGAVFLLFAGGSETQRSTRTYFEVIDGVVTRHWTEQSKD